MQHLVVRAAHSALLEHSPGQLAVQIEPTGQGRHFGQPGELFAGDGKANLGAFEQTIVYYISC